MKTIPRWDVIRFQKEKALTRWLEQVLHTDIILKISRKVKKSTKNFFQEVVVKGQGIQISPLVTPDLWSIVQDVQKRLHIEDEVEFYIVQHPTMNAFASMEQDAEGRLAVFFHSQLIERCNPAELRFIVGHELGHLILDSHRIHHTLQTAYQGGKSLPYSLQNMVSLWKKFNEVSADRVGYLACQDLHSCITSMIKLASGVNLDFQRFKLADYLTRNRDILTQIGKGDIPRGSSHPIPAIRIRALELFSQSDLARHFDQKDLLPDETLQAEMDALAAVMETQKDSELDYYRQIFIVTGGMVVATLDKELHPDEKEKILETVSLFFHYPHEYIQSILEEIRSQEDLLEVFVESATKILQLDSSERYPMLNFLIEVAFADGRIREVELQFITDVGMKIFGFSEPEINQIILEKLSQGAFVPGIEFPL